MESRKQRTDVPYIAYEADLSRMERITKRLTWALIASLLTGVSGWIVALLR